MTSLGTLRPVVDDDLALMREWRNAPLVRANMYTRHEISPEEHQDWWERTRQRDDQAYFLYHAAERPAGVVGFTAIDAVNGNCSWAFYAAPDAPKGTGSRMELLALDHAFAQLGMHKLYCEVLAFNEAVIKLHQKFGFSVEGILREHHRMDDSFADIYRLGLLAGEWAIRRGEILAKLTRDNSGLRSSS